MRDAGRRARASLRAAGNLLLLVAGAIVGFLASWLFALLYLWAFDAPSGVLVVPFAGTVAVGAVFVGEPALRPLSYGMAVGALLQLLLFLWIVETTGS